MIHRPVQGEKPCSGTTEMPPNGRKTMTNTSKLTGQAVGLADDANLVRDFESPHDELVGMADPAPFDKGPVFITRRQHAQLHITVNSKPFTEVDGVKKRMTGRQIAALVSDNPDATEVFQLKSPQPEPVPLDREIPIHDCDEFRVIRNNVAGGVEPARIQQE